MVAVVLLGVGITAAVGVFGHLAHTEWAARQTEKMQRLAQSKLNELVATGQATTSTSGDFNDDNEPDFTWSLQVDTSGITDLNAVTLTVTRRNDSTMTSSVDSLVYVPPTDTGTTGGGTQ